MNSVVIKKLISLVILLFLFLLFLPVGIIAIPIGFIVLSISIFIIYLELFLKQKGSKLLIICSMVSFALVATIIIVPHSHVGYGYTEDGEKITPKHKHSLWKLNHIH